MDPTEDEQRVMTNVAEVFKGADLDPSEMAEITKLSGSLAVLLGAAAATKPVTLGVTSEADYESIIANWRVPEAAGARPPTSIEMGKAKLVGHVCRALAGSGETIESLKRKAAAPSTPAPTPSVPSAAAARRIKLSSIVSQIDDTEILMADEKEVLKAFARYEAVDGKGDHRTDL